MVFRLYHFQIPKLINFQIPIFHSPFSGLRFPVFGFPSPALDFPRSMPLAPCPLLLQQPNIANLRLLPPVEVRLFGLVKSDRKLSVADKSGRDFELLELFKPFVVKRWFNAFPIDA